MMSNQSWPDQFAGDPALLAAADQIDAEARDADPRRVAALALVMAALEPVVVGGQMVVDATGIVRMAAEVEALAAENRALRARPNAAGVSARQVPAGRSASRRRGVNDTRRAD